MSDLYVDLSDFYVDFSDLDVDLSDLYTDVLDRCLYSSNLYSDLTICRVGLSNRCVYLSVSFTCRIGRRKKATHGTYNLAIRSW